MDKAPSVLHYQKALDAAPLNVAASLFKGTRLPDVSPLDMEALHKFEDEYPEAKLLTDNKSKRAFFSKKHDELKRQIEADHRILRKKKDHLENLREKNEKVVEVTDWMDRGIHIERPDGTSFRDLRKAVANGKTVYFDKGLYAETPAHDFEKEVFRYAEVMVIEHDWAAAFEHANVQDAVIRLPYDVCAFDFKFSGRRVIALATQLDTDIAFTPAICCGDFWALFGFVVPASGRMAAADRNGIIDLIDVMAAQIRAACIALDSEVAKCETVREPHAGLLGNNSYQPLKSYHVVSLAHRSARPLQSSSMSTGRKVRLHFRRGHWRHFEDHKTWIKWMLVGYPNLGFVDKEYRL